MEYNSTYAEIFPFISNKDYKKDALFINAWINSNDNPKVMDFGSGCGLHLKELIQNRDPLDYLGVEPSKHMRTESRKIGVNNLVKSVTLVEDKDFTHIFSLYNVLNCLNHIDVFVTLDQLLSRLQAGGQFLFEIWNPETDTSQLKPTERSFDYQGSPHKLTCTPINVEENSLKLHYTIKKDNSIVCESAQHINLHSKAMFDSICAKHTKQVNWNKGLVLKNSKASLSIVGLIYHA